MFGGESIWVSEIWRRRAVQQQLQTTEGPAVSRAGGWQISHNQCAGLDLLAGAHGAGGCFWKSLVGVTRCIRFLVKRPLGFWG